MTYTKYPDNVQHAKVITVLRLQHVTERFNDISLEESLVSSLMSAHPL
jgi:hypothetical protein